MPNRIVSSQAKVRSQEDTGRHLHGRWLYLARGGYIIILLIILSLYGLGTPGYIRYLDEGKIGVDIDQNKLGEIILLPRPGLDASQTGVLKGDVLLAVNGTPTPPRISIEEAVKLLKGKKGESVTITVRTDNEAPRDYKIVRSQLYLTAGEQLHIPFSLLKIVLVVLSIISLLGLGIISLLIFIWRSDDWLAFLVALALITFAAISDNVYLGTKAIGWTAVYYSLDSIGSFLPVLLLCLFPNGRFVPHWAGRFSRILFLWAIPSFMLLAFSDCLGSASCRARWPIASSFLRTSSPPPWLNELTFWVWMLLFSIGVYAQIYRFLYVSNPVERQQIKWIVIGIPLAVLTTISVRLVPESPLITAPMRLFLADVLFSISQLANLFVAIGLGLAVFRYKLWDTDFYINRTWVYGTVTGALAILWWLSVELLQALFNRFTTAGSPSSPVVAALLSSVQVAALFRPARDLAQNWINTRFYKDRVDFTKAIVELQPENWHFISAGDMYHALTENTASLLDSDTSAVYIYNGRATRLVSVRGVTSTQARRLKFDEAIILDLQRGKVVPFNQEKPFALLVPLVVPRQHVKDLIGVLALGRRVNERGYSRDHINDLKNLGERAGMAIHFLQLNEKKLSAVSK